MNGLQGNRILLTGATGFVGRALARRLLNTRKELRAALRHPASVLPRGAAAVQIGEIGPKTRWNEALAGIDVVIHLAARVHLMNDPAADPLAAFRQVNTEGTINLALQAAALGVRRLVYVSSVKVNGEETVLGIPFSERDPLAPIDPYAISKGEAEQGLHRIARERGMEVVIIRPPLVYGPGVKANFLAMLRWLRKGLPLPLGAIRNKRTLVALDNLVDLITTCISHPAAANQVFMAGDGEDLSITELLQRTGKALGKPARLLPVPSWALATGGAVLGRRETIRRLCGSLQVDTGKARTILGWSPPIRVDDALCATARHFLEYDSC